jgi:hypothetical protein
MVAQVETDEQRAQRIDRQDFDDLDAGARSRSIDALRKKARLPSESISARQAHAAAAA